MFHVPRTRVARIQQVIIKQVPMGTYLNLIMLHNFKCLIVLLQYVARAMYHNCNVIAVELQCVARAMYRNYSVIQRQCN